MQVREFAGAGEHFAALGDAGLTCSAGGGDLRLDHIVAKRREGAAGFFDVLELRPCGVAQFARQRLDAAGTGGGIGDLGEIGLFQQHQLGVARSGGAQAIGQAERQRMR